MSKDWGGGGRKPNPELVCYPRLSNIEALFLPATVYKQAKLKNFSRKAK